ncbi:Peptidase S8/S53 domain [Arabidopsis suecica]|uniref:Peptidase S8/S53 domain n=1 Tax=Arabidopsis suecica TaxID=45249 RepID=A0A8T1ZDZ2_ARASU|nr:Peptidase S8/S53 domain [Arabidopsis suecica]
MEGVVSVFPIPSKKLQIQTTASCNFMGLKEGKNTKRNLAVESDTITGVIEIGIWPESESFSDKGFGPPPKKWKGVCSDGKISHATRARDYTGEGARETAVVDKSFFGIGNGTVRGAVPASRIAAYKVCLRKGCTSEAILAAFDDAIADGVDLITISLDGYITSFENDPTLIGSFQAMAKGILTVNSAANIGPSPGLGKSVNAFDLKEKNYPLVFGKSAALSACNTESADNSEGLKIAKSMGAVASIIIDPNDYAVIHALPFSALSQDDFDSLLSYINSTKSPEAAILKTESIFNHTAPKVAFFSARGPNSIAFDILKHQEWKYSLADPPVVSLIPPYKEENDSRRSNYAVLARTSIFCPHIIGAAAYVKTFYPEWSPSMIKSAIMTTAWPMNATGTGYASTEFAYGAGHVDPIPALNPGLVYESTKSDYIAFLCGMNYMQ